jgi:putative Holliday junction resolvase
MTWNSQSIRAFVLLIVVRRGRLLPPEKDLSQSGPGLSMGNSAADARRGQGRSASRRPSLADRARRLLRRPMPVLPLPELRAALSPGQRLLGLDLGEKTIGVAVSDSQLSVATAVSTIQRKKLAADLAALRQIMAERNVGGLVIGLPLNMDGSEGPRCQSVRQFARNLLVQMDLPIAFWDERLSTMAVTRPMLEADLTRGKRARAVDSLAATYILQGALDAAARGQPAR